MVRRFVIAIFLAVVLCVASSAPSGAQVASDDPVRFAEWAVSDMTAAVGGAARVQSLIAAGGAVGVLLLLSPLDEPLSRGARSLGQDMPQRLRSVFHEVGNVKMACPMAVALFLGSLTSSSERFQDAAFTSLQAILLSNLATNGLKLVVGRAWPYQRIGASSLKPFSGRRSFPSGHATTAFALTVPWLMYYPRVETLVLASLGLGTALVRVADDYHWFTDVLAGAAIGAGTGYLLSRRHRAAAPRVSLSPAVTVGGGMGIRLVISLASP